MDSLRALLIATFVSAIISSAIFFATRQAAQNTDDARYGAQAGSMVLAARGYAQQNRSAILTSLTSSGGAAVGFNTASMITAGLLDPSVNGTTPTGGTYCLEFRSYNAGANLQGVLTVINETSPKSQIDAAVVSQQAGTPFTGTVDATGNVVYPGGSQALSAFTGPNACSAQTNAFAAIITDGDTLGTTNYLCRVGLPQQPSCSTMTLDLNMGANNVTNASSFTATGMDPTASGQLRQVFGNFGSIIRNDGSDFEILFTASGNQTGTFNTLRPLVINLANGQVSLDQTGAGVGLGGTLTANGQISAPAFAHTSDATLKSAFEPIADPFAALAPLTIGRFHWLESGKPDIGFTAQSAAATLPELVSHRADGKLQLSYDGIFAIGIQAIEDDHRRLLDDEAEIAHLTARLAGSRRAVRARVTSAP